MRCSTLTSVLVAHMFLVAASVHAQSLGDVARKEEARRKGVTAPAKVYTNDNLQKVDPPVPPSTPSSAVPPAEAAAIPATPATPAAAGPAEAPRDEKYWRGRLENTRTALSRAQLFGEALQSRINALSTDFVNRDDPAQRSVIAADRQKALAELDRVKQEIAQHQKAIGDIQEEGRRAGVPAGWLR